MSTGYMMIFNAVWGKYEAQQKHIQMEGNYARFLVFWKQMIHRHQVPSLEVPFTA